MIMPQLLFNNPESGGFQERSRLYEEESGWNSYESVLLQYQWKVEICNNSYRCDPAVEAFRNIKAIDSSRHPQFPDDIVVFFVREGMKPEGIWCQLRGQRNDHICGRLLNTPYGFLGVTQGDVVEIIPVRVGDGFKAVALI